MSELRTPTWLKVGTIICFAANAFFLGLDVAGIGSSTWPIDLTIFVVMGLFLIGDAIFE